MQRIKFVDQLTAHDNCVAALAMVLQHYSLLDDVEELRQYYREIVRRHKGDRVIEEILARYGLSVCAITEIQSFGDLCQLSSLALLLCDGDRHIVLSKCTRYHAQILDPGQGPLRLNTEEVNGILPCRGMQFSHTRPLLAVNFRPQTLRQTVSYFARLVNPIQIWIIVVLSLTTRFFLFAPFFLLGVSVAPRSAGVSTASPRYLTALALGVLAIVLAFCKEYFIAHFGAQLDQDFDTYYRNHLLCLPIDFFVERYRGDLLSRANTKQQARILFMTGVFSPLLDILTIPLILAAAYYLSVFLGVLLSLAAVVKILISLCVYRPSLILENRKVAAVSSFLSLQMGILAGIEEFKANAGESPLAREWKGRFGRLAKADFSKTVLEQTVNGLLRTVDACLPAVVVFAGLSNQAQASLSLAALAILASVSTLALQPLSQLTNVLTNLASIRASGGRLLDLINHPVESDEGTTDVRLSGRFDLRDVKVWTPDHATEILKDVNLSVAAGSMVGIYGKSGSGKTTLIRMLTGLHVAFSGAIEFDGINSRQLSLSCLRRQIATVPQSAVLPDGTIAEIVAGNSTEIDYERVESCLRTSAILDDLVCSSRGLHSRLLNGGATLSGGQRQRISIARALYKNPSLLILDEALSQLDPATELIVLRNLRERNQTTILVSHRITALRQMDILHSVTEGTVMQSSLAQAEAQVLEYTQ